MLDKAQGLGSDQVFLDLEDSVSPLAKVGARANIVAALQSDDWDAARIRTVRVNDWSTEWTYGDVIAMVEGAGDRVDCIMLPKVESSAHVVALDLLLAQLERSNGLPVGTIGIEAQIESAAGLIEVDAIAGASSRTECLIFGPADFGASIGMRTLVVGDQPPSYEADAYHHILMSILMAARRHGIQAIDGPYGRIKDNDGYAKTAHRSASLGYDGKWVLHPDQIGIANEIYRPTQEEFDRAENILDAYAWYTSSEGGAIGAVMFGDEMIDEASRKMAVVVSAKGRAAGLAPSHRWEPPAGAALPDQPA